MKASRAWRVSASAVLALAACGPPEDEASRTQVVAAPDDAIRHSDYSQSIDGSEVTFDMVWIEEGGFWIGKHEVTWDEYLLYCDFEESGAVPPDADAVSKPSKPLDWTPYDRDWGAGRRPAVGMSWSAAQKYCQWLSQNTGVAYRLPTEEEWALACGTGFPEGREPARGDAAAWAEALDEVAWFATNSDDKTQPVGGKAPNQHGLHDMLGNLWEYCREPFSAEETDRAVLRGGAWKTPAGEIAPSARLGFDFDWTLRDPNYPPGVWWIPDGDHLGLRVLREGPAPDGAGSGADSR